MDLSRQVPPQFDGREAQGLLAPGQTVAQYELGTARNFVYLLTDWETRTAALVDPQSDLAPIAKALQTHRLRLTHILLTHSHWDHVAGLPGLAASHPDALLCLHEREWHRLSPHYRGSFKTEFLIDGATIQLGRTRIEVLHTPGHSAGELCFLIHADGVPHLLTGDTLFIRECGRTDLDTGNDAEMFASLQRLAGLPPATVILPGHHYTFELATQLAQELQTNAPLRARSVEELATL